VIYVALYGTPIKGYIPITMTHKSTKGASWFRKRWDSAVERAKKKPRDPSRFSSTLLEMRRIGFKVVDCAWIYGENPEHCASMSINLRA